MNPATPEAMLEAVRASVPHLKTQAQLTAYMASFDALRLTLDAIYAGDAPREQAGLGALEKAFDVARKATEMAVKLEEVPPEARGPASAQFTNAPSEYQEYDLQKRLLIELDGITSMDALANWYEATKDNRDHIVSQGLRNILIDSIREKRIFLESQDA